VNAQWKAAPLAMLRKANTLQLRALAGQIGVSFVPINLRFHTPS